MSMVLGLWLRSLVVALLVMVLVVLIILMLLLSNVPKIVGIGSLIVSITVLFNQLLLLLHQ